MVVVIIIDFYERFLSNISRSNCIPDVFYGAALLQRDKVDADFVAGIPDSGMDHASGYINEKKISLKRLYVNYISHDYQKLNDLVDAIGLHKEELSTHCLDG